MKSEEKNKLKKLLRKSHSKNYVKKRLLLNSITANRATIKAHKSHIANSNSLKAKEFSIDMIKACADMNAISPFNPEEYTFLLKHLKEVTLALIQRSIRFMEQNRRGVPNASDIDSAAQSMVLVPPLGVGNTEFIPFHTGGRNALPIISNDSFYAKESKDIDVMSLIKRKPASVVCDASLSVHWLAIEGVQPYSPQNPPPDTLKRLSQISGVIPTTDDVSKDTMNKIPLQPMTLRTEVGLSQTIKTTRCHPRAMESLVIERRPHNVSQELMLYFRELTEACVGGNENRRKEALENLYLDTGLQPLMPYLVTFITEGSLFTVILVVYILRYDLLPVSSSILSLEHLRMMMKSHAFVRANAEKLYKAQHQDYKNTPTDMTINLNVVYNFFLRLINGEILSYRENHAISSKCVLPNFSHYIYFLFAPTLIYRDAYPRSNTIRWKFVISNFLQFLACIFFGCAIFSHYCFHYFEEFDQRQKFTLSVEQVMFHIFQFMIPSSLIMILGFYSFLHCWLNAFAEMLRFGDGLLYKDWWNEFNFYIFLRKWNVVVHDWLYTYVYRDLYILFNFKWRSIVRTVAFLFSAIIHEYVIIISFRFFYTLQLIFLILNGVALVCVKVPKRDLSILA